MLRRSYSFSLKPQWCAKVSFGPPTESGLGSRLVQRVFLVPLNRKVWTETPWIKPDMDLSWVLMLSVTFRLFDSRHQWFLEFCWDFSKNNLIVQNYISFEGQLYLVNTEHLGRNKSSGCSVVPLCGNRRKFRFRNNSLLPPCGWIIKQQDGVNPLSPDSSTLWSDIYNILISLQSASKGTTRNINTHENKFVNEGL